MRSHKRKIELDSVGSSLHKLLFKRWLVSNKNQLECQGRSALLSVQFTLDNPVV